jgi:3-hydroxymyristoyl/3-hydroxydecanoyl-(acyl carrier protein) dehydratase
MSSVTLRTPLPLAADHPALAGHFPGHPIYPGVVLLDAAIGAIEAHFGAPVRGLPVAKFLAPVRPGMALMLQADRGESGVRFELATVDGLRVATGIAVLRADDDLPRGRL